MMTDAAARRALAERLDAGLTRLELNLPAAGRERLLTYLDLLARWNRRYNLTAVRDPLAMVGRHLLDSLAAVPFLESAAAGAVLDLGTGAGLPGLPLAIARPDLTFVLLDSVGKKTRFVRHAAAACGLDNIEVMHARIDAYRPARKFATITARALTTLTELCACSVHLRDADTRLLAFKGRYPDAEIAALSASGAQVQARRLEIPFTDGERHLIAIHCTQTRHA